MPVLEHRMREQVRRDHGDLQTSGIHRFLETTDRGFPLVTGEKRRQQVVVVQGHAVGAEFSEFRRPAPDPWVRGWGRRKGSRACHPTVHRPNVNLSSGRRREIDRGVTGMTCNLSGEFDRAAGGGGPPMASSTASWPEPMRGNRAGGAGIQAAEDTCVEVGPSPVEIRDLCALRIGAGDDLRGHGPHPTDPPVGTLPPARNRDLLAVGGGEQRGL